MKHGEVAGLHDHASISLQRVMAPYEHGENRDLGQIQRACGLPRFSFDNSDAVVVDLKASPRMPPEASLDMTRMSGMQELVICDTIHVCFSDRHRLRHHGRSIGISVLWQEQKL